MVAVTLLFHETAHGIVYQPVPASIDGFPCTSKERLFLEVTESAVQAAFQVLARDQRLRVISQRTEYLDAAQQVAQAALDQWAKKQSEAPET